MSDAMPNPEPGQEAIEATVQIVNHYGMHARPATRFVEVAGGFESELRVSKDGAPPVNGKSVMGLLTLAAEKGSTLTIRAEGPDARAVVDRMVTLVSNSFEMEEN